MGAQMLFDSGLCFSGFVLVPEDPFAGLGQRTKISLLDGAPREPFAQSHAPVFAAMEAAARLCIPGTFGCVPKLNPPLLLV
jgi:hypothetical protein